MNRFHNFTNGGGGGSGAGGQFGDQYGAPRGSVMAANGPNREPSQPMNGAQIGSKTGRKFTKVSRWHARNFAWVCKQVEILRKAFSSRPNENNINQQGSVGARKNVPRPHGHGGGSALSVLKTTLGPATSPSPPQNASPTSRVASPTPFGSALGNTLPRIVPENTGQGTVSAITRTLRPMSLGHPRLEPDQPRKTWGASSIQGRRPYQEDEYQVVTPMEALTGTAAAEPTSFFAVFDGHAGGRCSKFLTNELARNIAEDPSFQSDLPAALNRGFLKTNEVWMRIADQRQMNDGSCCIVVVQRGRRIHVANVGDSRAVLCSNAEVASLSFDQKPNRPLERRRIQAAGGRVVNCFGVSRVNGLLAVARAFGDRALRRIVRADPEIITRDLKDSDAYVVIASDGLWDVITNQEASDCILKSRSELTTTAQTLTSLALRKGSMDNTTALVIDIRDPNRGAK
jgi:serine/threonine protein phosphatase PrpC